LKNYLVRCFLNERTVTLVALFLRSVGTFFSKIDFVGLINREKTKL